MSFFKQFGGKVTSTELSKLNKSSAWKGKMFVNQEHTSMSISPGDVPKLLWDTFIDRKGREPKAPLPIMPLPTSALSSDDGIAKFVWYGHSAVLLHLQGKNILIDPMLGDNASPIAPFKTKRFSPHALDVIDMFPPIDAVLMTHDHYDHLDYDSIMKLKGKVSHWWVALGVGRHLERWGVPSNEISEFDWWQSKKLDAIDITFTPSRHFSGRGISDRAKSLWGGWVLKSEEFSVYWSGDGGYGPHFEEVGKRLGPFDWGFMECGQYNEKWHQIHMYPEECVKAAIDAQVKHAIPVYWGAFTLALHTWTDSVDRFIAEAKKEDLAFSTPRLGELVRDTEVKVEDWWKQ